MRPPEIDTHPPVVRLMWTAAMAAFKADPQAKGEPSFAKSPVEADRGVVWMAVVRGRRCETRVYRLAAVEVVRDIVCEADVLRSSEPRRASS